MIKKRLLQLSVIFLVFGLGTSLGFHVGARKMWAHSNVYFGGAGLSKLTRNYPVNQNDITEDGKLHCKLSVSNAVDAYVRYITRWESKVWTGADWERFSEREGRKLIIEYAEFAKIKPGDSFENHWQAFWSKADYIKDLEKDNPALYDEERLHALRNFERFQHAFKRLNIKE